MYSRHVYGSNTPLKYTVMLWYQQLYLRNKVSMFWHAYFQTSAYYRASTVNESGAILRKIGDNVSVSKQQLQGEA